VDGRIEVQMGTLGKALGAAGGFIAGSAVLIDWLVNRARSFVFTTAPVPAAAGAALAALEIATGGEGERRRGVLRAHAARLRETLGRQGWSLPPVQGPIFPVVIGEERAALEAAARLRDAGFLVPAVRYPTVARGTARLRITLSAAHHPEDVDRLCAALVRAVPLPSPSPVPMSTRL
jgi:7-keto-8-aminopelargonate synthetase-like enzyme